MNDTFKVYVRIDAQNRITAVDSDANLASFTDWIEIDEGTGDKYHHAQTYYFDGDLYESHGIPRYKYINNEPVERTQAEIEADIAALPEPEPTAQEQTDALIIDHEERLIYLELGVNE